MWHGPSAVKSSNAVASWTNYNSDIADVLYSREYDGGLWPYNCCNSRCSSVADRRTYPTCTACLLSGAAAAQGSQNWKWCSGHESTSLDQRLAVYNAIIETNGEMSMSLAISPL
jgi:hypothetical protein